MPTTNVLAAAAAFLVALQVAAAGQAPQQPSPSAEAAPAGSAPAAASPANRVLKPGSDTSGKPQIGKATFYHGRGTRRHPAPGQPQDAAASRTLPIGTRAEVTNLANGKSSEVEINDRGPLAPDKIIDVTPSVADKLDMKQRGVQQVEVKPLAVPQPDGTVKQTGDQR